MLKLVFNNSEHAALGSGWPGTLRAGWADRGGPGFVAVPGQAAGTRWVQLHGHHLASGLPPSPLCFTSRGPAALVTPLSPLKTCTGARWGLLQRESVPSCPACFPWSSPSPKPLHSRTGTWTSGFDDVKAHPQDTLFVVLCLLSVLTLWNISFSCKRSHVAGVGEPLKHFFDITFSTFTCENCICTSKDVRNKYLGIKTCF